MVWKRESAKLDDCASPHHFKMVFECSDTYHPRWIVLQWVFVEIQMPEVGDKKASRGLGLSISTMVNATTTNSTTTIMFVRFVPENHYFYV